MHSDSAGDSKKPLVLLDMDTVLMSSEGDFNLSLIETLKKFGIKDVCLLTSVSAEAMLDDEVDRNRDRYARMRKFLEENGFVVHAVITPVDLVYEEPGLAWRERMEPQLEILQDKASDQWQEQEVIEAEIAALDWEYDCIWADFIEHTIKGDINEEAIQSLKSRIQRLEGKIQALQTGEKIPLDIEQINYLMRLRHGSCRQLAVHFSTIEKFFDAGPDKKTMDAELNVDAYSKALDYILKIPEIQRFPWVHSLFRHTRNAEFSFQGRGGLYAFVMQSSLLSQFGTPIFLDTDPDRLEAIEAVHSALHLPEPCCVEVDPDCDDTEEYYKEELSKAVPKDALLDELNSLSELQRVELESLAESKRELVEKFNLLKTQLKTPSKLHSPLKILFDVFAQALNVFIHQVQVLINLQARKKHFFEKFDYYIEFVTAKEKREIYDCYQKSSIGTYKNYGLWSDSKTSAEKKIDTEIKKLQNVDSALSIKKGGAV